VVEAAIELMAPAAHAKNVELTGFLGPEVPAMAIGDPARLRQVLLNLIGNAVKFTSQGEICVTVACEHQDVSDLVLRIAVTDTGVGIPVHAKPRLFSAFMQADNSTTRKYGGTGLGLAISRQIVSLMNGEIGMESVEGQGSTFWFTCRLGRDRAAVSNAGDASLAGGLAGALAGEAC
jgi:signal transduction histidine kinase